MKKVIFCDCGNRIDIEVTNAEHVHGEITLTCPCCKRTKPVLLI